MTAERDEIVLKDQVLERLRTVIDPDLHRDIVSLKFVKNLHIDYTQGSVSMDLQLTTPACPVKDKFVEEIDHKLKDIGWVSSVNVTLTAQQNRRSSMEGQASSLTNVSFVLLIASCKGGVGKSSIAVNLAYMLSMMGAKVGLCDADVYGPSLGYQVPLREKVKGTPAGNMSPLEHKGVKLMSYGYLRPGDFAALRGPLASGMVKQMLTMTEWGDLDYLIVDMPPGTGDIHMTVAQSIKANAALMVTTPQQLSLVDVEKGVRVFNQLNIPTVGVIENMSYFVCDGCDKKHEIFQRGDTRIITDGYGIKHYFRLPLAPEFSRPVMEGSGKEANDEGLVFPYVLGHSDSDPLWKELRRTADVVARELSASRFGKKTPEVFIGEDNEVVLVTRRPIEASTEGDTNKNSKENTDGETNGHVEKPSSNQKEEGKKGDTKERANGEGREGEGGDDLFGGAGYGDAGGGGGGAFDDAEETLTAPARVVRLGCRCAECIDEWTGQTRLNPKKVPHSVKAEKVTPTGNYAVTIIWTDGHSSLMSFAALERVMRTHAEKTAAKGCLADPALEW
uniref:MIP18 family-like domain-containing protein n=1 Tax=Chromera velia CCMP2878 TaxID=1169474 RepID=A0A0G4GS43_9ALVE|eukprot:Cvel_23131.t1-p1 / transcript=Cvel_23131.t1 / gene=Cvel_23131 / organism=Chromera_velia_CCMP2878 / gene_product=Protein mrp homolog, putative / transcript_product=Protein mrp homolog, putative / location=Cvel_scaffold2350:9259-14852(-) / protein_length=561 / sequence_SO=supercontig / SO=protein_coding / is_pseudo=false